MTARNGTKDRIELVTSKWKNAKDTLSSKVKNSFGVTKKSVQHNDSELLSKSTKTGIRRTKIKNKVNNSLANYNSNKSVKKTGHYSSQSQLLRPQSAFK